MKGIYFSSNIKSFAGVQGAVFQKNPLAAGGKNEQHWLFCALVPTAPCFVSLSKMALL